MKEIRPPQNIVISPHEKTIFLAGSIEMGQAIDWQAELVQSLDDWEGLILNPRRENWDNSWEQSIQNPVFREQVTWELEGLEKADLIVIYLAPGTRSPISLLELGLHAHSGKVVVCCPEGFWRKGNVDIVCERYSIQQVENLEGLLKAIRDLS